MRHLLRIILVWLPLYLGGCAWSHDISSRAEKAKLFETFFSMPLPDAVSDLKARRVRVGDSIADWIGLTCDDATFQQIVRSTGAVHIAASEAQAHLSGDLSNPNRPEWWPSQVDATAVVVYLLDRPYTEERSQADRLIFWRDPASQSFYAYYVAWT